MMPTDSAIFTEVTQKPSLWKIAWYWHDNSLSLLHWGKIHHTTSHTECVKLLKWILCMLECHVPPFIFFKFFLFIIDSFVIHPPGSTSCSMRARHSKMWHHYCLQWAKRCWGWHRCQHLTGWRSKVSVHWPSVSWWCQHSSAIMDRLQRCMLLLVGVGHSYNIFPSCILVR